MKVSLTEQTWFHGMSVTSAELPSEILCRCDSAQFAGASRTAVQDGIVTEANNPDSALQRGADVPKLPCWRVIVNTSYCCPPPTAPHQI